VLGESTVASIAIDAAEAGCKTMTKMASFDDAKVSKKL
jgi:hypothetical protein